MCNTLKQIFIIFLTFPDNVIYRSSHALSENWEYQRSLFTLYAVLSRIIPRVPYQGFLNHDNNHTVGWIWWTFDALYSRSKSIIYRNFIQYILWFMILMGRKPPVWSLWYDLTKHLIQYTVCPGNSDPVYIVSYYINWVTTSWTYSMLNKNTVTPVTDWVREGQTDVYRSFATRN